MSRLVFAAFLVLHVLFLPVAYTLRLVILSWQSAWDCAGDSLDAAREKA